MRKKKLTKRRIKIKRNPSIKIKSVDYITRKDLEKLLSRDMFKVVEMELSGYSSGDGELTLLKIKNLFADYILTELINNGIDISNLYLDIQYSW